MGKSLTPGMQVTAELKLVREIGRGSMGAVWLGETPAGEVAVKFLADHLKGDDVSVQRFDREWAVASSIDCRHIVRMLQSGTAENGQRYIVMELLDGETLEHVLDGIVGGMSPTATLTLLSQVAVALDAAHAKGIVHRDIKPENIFLCREEEGLIVKIVDFGLAKPWVGELNFTATGVLVGTPYYMSPEQLLEDGKKVDHRADLWALGGLAYRMLLGVQPFDSDNLTDLLVQVAMGKYRAVTDAGGARELVPFFERAFQVDRNKRFASAGELVRALRAALGLPPEDGQMPTVVMNDGPSLDRTQILEEPAERAMPAFAEAATHPFPKQTAGALFAPAVTTASGPPPVAVHTLHSAAPPPRRASGPPTGLVAAIAVVVLLLAGAGIFLGWRALSSGEQPAPAASPAASPVVSRDKPEPSAPPPKPARDKPAPSAPAPPAKSIDPAAAKKKIAFITVLCEPPCGVMLGPKKLGASPIKKRAVRPGEYKLRVYAKGYANQEQMIELVPGEHATFNMAMKR